MKPESHFNADRRSFVKNTLATSITISFAGLIRAHGEDGEATTAPETTMVFTTGPETTVMSYSTAPDTTGVGTYTTSEPVTTMVFTTGPETTMATTIATEPQTGAQVVEVIKQNPIGSENLSKSDIQAGKIIVKHNNDVTYECDLYWKVDLGGVNK